MDDAAVRFELDRRVQARAKADQKQATTADDETMQRGKKQKKTKGAQTAASDDAEDGLEDDSNKATEKDVGKWQSTHMNLAESRPLTKISF